MTQPVQTVLYYMYMCCSIKMVAFRNVCVSLKKGRIVLSTANACILLAAVVRISDVSLSFFTILIFYIPLHLKYKNSKKARKRSVISDYSC